MKKKEERRRSADDDTLSRKKRETTIKKRERKRDVSTLKNNNNNKRGLLPWSSDPTVSGPPRSSFTNSTPTRSSICVYIVSLRRRFSPSWSLLHFRKSSRRCSFFQNDASFPCRFLNETLRSSTTTTHRAFSSVLLYKKKTKGNEREKKKKKQAWKKKKRKKKLWYPKLHWCVEISLPCVSIKFGKIFTHICRSIFFPSLWEFNNNDARAVTTHTKQSAFIIIIIIYTTI